MSEIDTVGEKEGNWKGYKEKKWTSSSLLIILQCINPSLSPISSVPNDFYAKNLLPNTC
jgi:hypothetical protein